MKNKPDINNPVKLSGNDIVTIWETAEERENWYQGITILSRGLPHMEENQIRELSIGRRNTCLLELRRLVFGPEIGSHSVCTECEKKIAFNLNILDIRADDGVAKEGEGETLLSEPVAGAHFSLTLEDIDIGFRLPNSMDLSRIGGNMQSSHPRRKLLEQTVTHAVKDKENLDVKQLPDCIFDTLAHKLNEEYDPHFEIRLAFECPFCRHEWNVVFDILSFFWVEIRKRARELLRDVHILAAAYGWNEKEIFEMSPKRREYYMDCQTTVNQQVNMQRQKGNKKHVA